MERKRPAMQFRLSTCLLGMAVCATSFALAGFWGFPLAGCAFLLIAYLRAKLSGQPTVLGDVVVTILGLALAGCCCIPVYSHAGPNAFRIECAISLKNIALALENYRCSHGSFPPPSVSDKTGKPIHSWRVLILPYVEQQPLYDAYHFDEPWNGPNNSKLAAMRPRLFDCPSDEASRAPGSSATSYLGVIPEDGCWGDRMRGDGTAPRNPVILIEMADSGVGWAEPKDLRVDQILARLSSTFRKKFSGAHSQRLTHVALADGRVEELPCNLPEQVLHQVLTEDFDRLYSHVSRKEIERMRQDIPDIRLIGLRFLACAISIVVLLIHGVYHDRCQKLQQGQAVTGASSE